MSWAENISNILPAAVKEIWVKYPGDDAYYNLGDLFDGMASSAPKSQPNKTKMPKNYNAIDFLCTAKLMWTSKTRMLQLLPTLSGAKLDFIIVLMSGQTLCSEEITSAKGTGFGFKWKIVTKGNMDSIRHVEISINRTITKSDWLDMFTAPTYGTQDSGDTLYAMRLLSTDDEHAGGVAKIEFRRATSPVHNITFEIDPDTCTVTDNPFVDGDAIMLTAGGALPTGLSAATRYFVINTAGNNFQLSLTSGGAALEWTDVGTPPNTIAYDTTTWSENLGSYRNADLAIELKTFINDDGRFVKQGQVMIAFSVEATQSSSTEVDMLAKETGNYDLTTTDFDWRITLNSDGTILTCNDNLGVTWDMKTEKDSDDVQVIKLTAAGAVPLSSLAAMIT